MWNRFFPNNRTPEQSQLSVEPLRPADVGRVRLGWNSSFNSVSLARQIERQPQMAWWVPRTGDYILGEPWRKRTDIGCVVELGAQGANRAALLERLLAIFRVEDYRAAVLNYEGWESYRKFYEAEGWQAVEKIVYFEKPTMAYSYQPPPAFASEIEIAQLQAGEMATVIAIDHAAFPWLWWNSREEMDNYSLLPDVRIFLARYQGQPLGYFSFTAFDRWGHLDRIAVDPRAQGIGLGAAQLARCIEEMKKRRISRITLSTQATNYQSQKLYTRFGFHQTNESYYLWGRSLTGDGIQR